MTQRWRTPASSICKHSRRSLHCEKASQPLANFRTHMTLSTPSCSSTPSVRRQTSSRRTYYTPSNPTASPYPPTETAILSAAYAHIPTHGFTTTSLRHGATDAGYLPASINLFPRGAFDLVLYHLVTQRLALKDKLQFPSPTDSSGASRPLGTTAKVRALLLARLRANEPVKRKLPEALGHMSLLGNIPASMEELARLVDEIWYLAGDISVDNSWYTKRGTLAGVYATAEVFMTQDVSPGFKDTEEFVDRRLDEVRRMGSAVGGTVEWVGFTGTATVNVLRSWGMRI